MYWLLSQRRPACWWCALLPHQHAVDATTVRFYPTGTRSTRSLRENTDYTGTCGRIFFFVEALVVRTIKAAFDYTAERVLESGVVPDELATD